MTPGEYLARERERMTLTRVMLECQLNWQALCELQRRGDFPQPLDGTRGNEYRRADIERWKATR
jgi:hypothetical protein